MQGKNVAGANSLRHSLISPLFSLINVSATPFLLVLRLQSWRWYWSWGHGGSIFRRWLSWLCLSLDILGPSSSPAGPGGGGWGGVWELLSAINHPDGLGSQVWDRDTRTQHGDPGSDLLPTLSHRSFKVGEGLQAIRRHLCFSVQQTTLPFQSLGAPRTTSKQTDQPQGKPLEWGGEELEEGTLQPRGGDGISTLFTFAGNLGWKL